MLYFIIVLALSEIKIYWFLCSTLIFVKLNCMCMQNLALNIETMLKYIGLIHETWFPY